MNSHPMLVLVLSLILSGCGTIVYPDIEQKSPPSIYSSAQDLPSQTNATQHRVKKGETLYSIAYHYGVEYRTLAGWNKIRSPYQIFIGQQLILKPKISHRVKKMETLYSIAFRYGVDLHALAQTNRIKPPYRIFVGDNITIIPQANAPVSQAPAKVAATKASKRAPTIKAGKKEPAIKTTGSKPKGNKVVISTPKSPVKVKTGGGSRYNSSNKMARWKWPVRGKVVGTFSPKEHRKGIDIRGKVGNKIVAANSGDVVYSGNGLLGYGNLIIIRHSSSYLSAYGHNRKLLVKEGTTVKQGQQIAEMGSTRKQGAILHFEIRRNGKPVNPTRYLPRL